MLPMFKTLVLHEKDCFLIHIYIYIYIVLRVRLMLLVFAFARIGLASLLGSASLPLSGGSPRGLAARARAARLARRWPEPRAAARARAARLARRAARGQNRSRGLPHNWLSSAISMSIEGLFSSRSVSSRSASTPSRALLLSAASSSASTLSWAWLASAFMYSAYLMLTSK